MEEIRLGDVIQTRKAHPCGNDMWRITYVGADVKMRCEKCSRIVMLDRPTFEKRMKKIVESAAEAEA